MSLEEALLKIRILEQENLRLQEELTRYQKYKPQGRKPHDEKWTKSFHTWQGLYEAGMPMSKIAAQTGLSRRTCYRYKAHYEELKLTFPACRHDEPA